MNALDDLSDEAEGLLSGKGAAIQLIQAAMLRGCLSLLHPIVKKGVEDGSELLNTVKGD